jgi:hypothetical protein
VPNNVIKYTTKELLEIVVWHASGEEAVRVVFILGDEKMAPGSSWPVPSKATSKGAKKCAKGGKKGRKRHPGCHTPFRESRNEASIRVPRMFHSHV